VDKCNIDLPFKVGHFFIRKVINMQVESGKFYFIKDEFFELFKNYELMQNKEILNFF